MNNRKIRAKAIRIQNDAAKKMTFQEALRLARIAD